DEWCKPLGQYRHFVEDLIRVETFAAVSFDDAIRVFEIALNARTKHVGHQRVGSANAATSGFVFISRADAAQSGTDFLVAESFLAGVVQCAMIGKDQMGARADLDALR